MLENTTNLAAQLKAFYKTRHEYANYILLITLTYIERLCRELE
jgi:hypothetical protein